MLPPHTSPNKNLVRHVALLTSRPCYWTVPPSHQTALKHAAGVARLLRWAMSFPNATLGIDPKGIGLILRAVHYLKRESLDPEIESALDRVGASESDVRFYLADLKLWESDEDCQRLIALLSRVRPGEYVWVAPEEAEWWFQKTEQAFQNYADLCGGDESHLLYLFIRYRCVVFAPFNTQHAIESLSQLLSASIGDDRAHIDALLQRAMIQYKLNDLLEITSPIYFSWRLVDFSVSKDDLIYQPMLALWNYWPANRRWAPPSEESQADFSLTADEAASLLEDVLWKKVETIFAIARQSCGIGFAEPEFAGREVASPVFYFVAPPELPARAEDYVKEYRPLLYPLVSTCLGSDDPFSLEIAWGILEGNLLALRRERVSQKSAAAWYLVLPFAPRSVSQEKIERDLDFVSDKTTFIEFSIGHEARDVDTDVREFATRYARWGGSLDSMGEQFSQFLKIFPIAKPGGRNRMKAEMAQLVLLLHRISVLLEKTNSDAQQTLRKFHGYLDGTEDFFRRAFTYTPLDSIGQRLQAAILDAYPYHYLQQPARSLENMIETVSNNLHGLIETAERELEQIERSERESQTRWTRVLSLLVGVLALLIALPQFVPGSGLTPDTYPRWLESIMPLTILEALVRLSVGIMVGVLILGIVAYGLYRFWRYFVQTEERTMKQIRNLWDLAERAFLLGLEAQSRVTAMSNGKTRARLEQMDEEASTLLCQIFHALHRAERGSHRHTKISQRFKRFWQEVSWGTGVSEWVERNAQLRQLIALFDLRPENIPLPRTLCLFHYKGSEFQSRSSISDWEFERSLRLAGFSSKEAERLQEWLSLQANRREIKDMECEAFLGLLKKYGVTAEDKRDPNKWEGIIHANK